MNIGIDIDDTITKTSEETDIYAKEYTESILKKMRRWHGVSSESMFRNPVMRRRLKF